MLKLLYKTLLVSILSFSLMLLNFSYQDHMVQFNSAQAETLKTDAVSDDNIFATLTMTAVGVLASRLYKYKMTTDIMLAAAGGAAFVAGDILAFFKNKAVINDLETQINRDEKGQIDQKQIESLRKLKESYMAAKDTATTKKNLQMAGAAAFAAAAISAYMMATTEETNQAMCLLGLQSAAAAGYAEDQAISTGKLTACSATCAGPQAAVCLAACKAQSAARGVIMTACKTKIATDMSLLTAYITARETPAPSAPVLTTTTSQESQIGISFPASGASCAPDGYNMFAAETKGNCPTMATINGIQKSGGAPAVADGLIYNYPGLPSHPLFQIEQPQKLISSNYAEKALDIFFPRVEAMGMMGMMGIGAGFAIKFILSTYTGLATTLDLNLLIPKRRAIVWGVLAGLALAASMATGAEIGKIQDNIDRIDKILNELDALQKGLATANNTAVTTPPISTATIGNNAIAASALSTQGLDLTGPGGPGALPCITGPNSANCPSFSDKLNAQPDIANMPSLVQTQIANIAKVADGINGKGRISASTLAQAQALAGQHNALRNEMLKQQNALQTRLLANGSNTDLARESANMQSQLRAAVQKELNSRKTTAGAMLASFGGGSSGPSGSTASDANQNVGDKNSINAKTNFSNLGGDSGIPSSHGLNLKGDLSADELKDKEAAAAAAAVKKTASIDEYDLKNDITQDKDASIFQLISNRYQKSYDRLFKRMK